MFLRNFQKHVVLLIIRSMMPFLMSVNKSWFRINFQLFVLCFCLPTPLGWDLSSFNHSTTFPHTVDRFALEDNEGSTFWLIVSEILTFLAVFTLALLKYLKRNIEDAEENSDDDLVDAVSLGFSDGEFDSVMPEVDDVDDLNEDLSLDKFRKGHKIKKKDRARKKKYLDVSSKKRFARLRKNGIMKAISSSSSSSEEVIPEMLSIDDGTVLRDGVRNSVVDSLIRQLSSIPQVGDSNIEFISSILCKTTSFLLKLSMCTDWKNTVKVFSTMLLDSVKSDVLFDMIGGGSLITPESSFDVEKWKNGISLFRNNTSVMKDTPGFSVIQKSLIILIFTGVTDHARLNSSKFGRLVLNLFGTVNRQVDVSELTFVDASLELLEFSLSLVDAIQKGQDMHQFLFPKSAVSKLAQYTSWLANFRQGTIKEVSGLSPEEYVAEVKSLEIELEMILASTSIGGAMRSLHYANYRAAVKLSADVESFHYSVRTRIQPVATLIYGEPGVGKTDICQRLHAIALSVHGLKYTPKETYYMKEGDKYDSSLRNDHSCFTGDDVGNIIDDNVDPRDTIIGQMIHIVNNVPSPSIQAALEDKGKIYHSPLSVVGTTNIIGGGIHRVTRSLGSYARRIRHIEVQVSDLYRNRDGSIDTKKVNELGRENIDLHEIRWFELQVVGNAVRQYKMSPWIPSRQFYREYGDFCREHFLEQRKYVRFQNAQFDMERCPSCGQGVGTPDCVCTEHEKEYAESVVREMNVGNVIDAVIPPTIHPEMWISGNLLENPRSEAILTWIVDHDWAYDWLTFSFRYYYYFYRHFPTNWRVIVSYLWDYICGSVYIWLMLAFFRRYPRDWLRLICIACCTYCVNYLAVYGLGLFLPIGNSLQLFLTLYNATNWIFGILIKWSQRLMMAQQGRRIQAGSGVNPIPLAFGSIVVLIGVYRLFRPFLSKCDIKPETIIPSNYDDVVERKKEENSWLTTYREPLPAPMELKSMTLEQVKKAIASNLFRVEVFRDSTANSHSVEGQGFFLNQSMVLLPHHMGKKDSYNVIGQREPSLEGRPNHSRFRSILHRRERIGETDFAKYVSTRSQPVANMLKFFPTELPKKGEAVAAVMIIMRKDKYIEQDVLWRTEITGHSLQRGIGSSYRLKYQTESGDCMAVVISRTKPHHILGFHMGSNGNGKGIAFSLTQREIVDSLGSDIPKCDPEHLDSLGLLVSPSEKDCDGEGECHPEMDADFDTESSDSDNSEVGKYVFQGTNFKLDCHSRLWTDFSGSNLMSEWGGIPNRKSSCDDPVLEIEVDTHPRCSVNFLQYDHLIPADMNYFGYDRKFIAHPTSGVKTSILSVHLEREGYPNKWGPPTFRSGRDHSTYLQLGTKSIDPLNPLVLGMASRDYFYGVVDELKTLRYPRVTGPITLDEALNGVDGDRFIKPIDESTAAGLRYGKKKKDHLIIKYYDEEGNEVAYRMGKKKFFPSEHLKKDIRDVIDKLSSEGFISMFVRSSLKDEPALIKPDGTTKVRIFGVLSFDMLLVGKMLFAPVASALLSIPTVSEMYQGISVLGHDWTEFYNHVIAFEPTQVGEGDYSKYDTSISGQLLRACGDILVNVARSMGYDTVWLNAMTSYVESVALNSWVFNGAVFIVDGWNPSGNWLTAIFAGMSNALLHRMVFYQHMRATVSFRNYVHLATLGDDSLFSTICPWFNCVTIQKYLASINMKYTPASKTGDVRPFVPPYEATFGKRTWRWEPAFNCFVAPLAKDSIFKSLHNYMESDTDPLTIAIGVVEQALLEMARHGRKEYESFRALMIRVCRRADIDHMIDALTRDYCSMLIQMFERQFDERRMIESYGDPAALECNILLDEQEL